MLLRDLVKDIQYSVLQGSLDTEVRACENDSRKIEEGTLFFCIAGANFDGHDFALQAASAGASVLVVEKDVPDVKSTDITVLRVDSTRYAMGVINLQ